jgi:hypothetical protein
MAARQDRELLPQRQVLERQVTSYAAEGAEPTEQESEPVEHGLRCSTNGLLRPIPTAYALNSSDMMGL